MAEREAHHRPDIEGLRALAITSVVLYHAGVPGFGGGFVGVDLFFVLSGFLITGLLVRELEKTGRLGLAHFWARRIRRLLPAATVVLLTVGVVASIAVPPMDRREVGLGVDAAALYAANWFFVRRRLDYLASDDAPSPVLHYWSLGVEEQFYIVWPLVVLAIARSAPGNLIRTRRRLLVGIGTVTALSLVASLALTPTSQPLAFFGSPARFWQLGVGAMLALARAPAVGAAHLGVAGAVVLAGSVVGMEWLVGSGFGYPGAAATLPTLATVALVAAGTSGWWGAAWLGAAPLGWLGRLSYSWYLWHWPVLLLSAADAGVGERLALAAASLGLAWVTHHMIENPVRFGPTFRRPERAFALGVVLTAASVTAGEVVRRTDTARIEARLLAGRPAPFRPLPSRARHDLPPPYADGCHLSMSETVSPPCVYGAAGAPRRVVLFGDSHATNLFPALEAIASEDGWQLVARVKSSCSPADVAQWDESRDQVYRACTAWREAVLGELERDPPEVVVVATIERETYDVPGATGPVPDPGAWREGLVRTLRRLVATGAQVVFVRDNPRAPRRALQCLSWTPLEPGRCDFMRSEAGLSDVMVDAARSVPLVRIADLTEAVCDVRTCHLLVGGTLVYRDSHHYTATFARTLAPRLRTVLEDG